MLILGTICRKARMILEMSPKHREIDPAFFFLLFLLLLLFPLLFLALPFLALPFLYLS
jgi:hypothetical protein